MLALHSCATSFLPMVSSVVTLTFGSFGDIISESAVELTIKITHKSYITDGILMMTTKYSTVNSTPSSRPLTLLHEQSKHTHLPIQTWVRSLHCGPWVANGVGGLCRKISWVAADWMTFWESLDADAVMRQLTVER